jgi:hypothetical protein
VTTVIVLIGVLVLVFAWRTGRLAAFGAAAGGSKSLPKAA